MKNELQQAISDFKDEQKALIKLVQAKFGDATKEIFDKYENLKSFGWRQYTVYFADGDECTFSAYLDLESLDINGERVDDYDEFRETVYKQVNGQYKSVANPDYDPRFNAMVEEISEFLTSIGEDILEEVFGDHVQITVTREGVEVGDYSDHD